jgi:uncharacterized protein (TIGR03083 family)
MATRTFAPWVEPHAARYREARAELVRVARQLPDGVWELPGPLPGWSYLDLLAHLAGNTGRNTHRLLADVLARRPFDLAVLVSGVDEQNARDVESRRGRSVDELIAELEQEGDDWDELLTGLKDDDKDYQPEGAPMTVGAFFEQAAGTHDREHLAQLRQALDQVML